MKKYLALIPALLLAGCATLAADVVGLREQVDVLAREDVQAALDMAKAATDAEAPYRAECYTAILTHIPTGPQPSVVPNIKGVVSAFEAAAEADQRLRAGNDLLPQDVRARCAILVASTEKFIIRIGGKAFGLPGLPSLPGVR